MKFLLENYSDESTTEPLYFTECLNRVGCEAVLWNPGQASMFDMYDAASPDVMVANLSSITLDLFKVLRGRKNTELVVHVSGASQEEISALEKAIDSNGINCPLIFGDRAGDRYKTSLKYLHVLKGADIFLQNQTNSLPEYTIEKAFMIEEAEEVASDGSYHVIGLRKDVPCDMFIPTSAFYQICKNYDEIVFKKTSTVFTQFFFDAHFYGNSVSVETGGENKGGVDKILSDYFDSDVQQSIKSRHTCTRRVARWLQKLGCKDEAGKVRKVTAHA